MADLHGLSESDLAQITGAIASFDEIAAAVLFGSRAKGNHKPGSDVDLAVKGDRVTHCTLAHLADRLSEETPLPYFFAVVQYDSLDDPAIVEHIAVCKLMQYSHLYCSGRPYASPLR